MEKGDTLLIVAFNRPPEIEKVSPHSRGFGGASFIGKDLSSRHAARLSTMVTTYPQHTIFRGLLVAKKDDEAPLKPSHYYLGDCNPREADCWGGCTWRGKSLGMFCVGNSY